MSSASKKSNESELWPLTTVNNPPLCAIDEEDGNLSNNEQKANEKKTTRRKKKKKKLIRIDSDVLVDRYHSTQKIDRDNVDALQYSSEDENQLQSPYSPNNNNWNDEEEEEEDF
jgi:hypothetical protein